MTQAALSVEAVEAELRGRFGRPCRYLPAVDSTNTSALTWASEGADEGAIVITDHQTAGRGRRGRTWFDEAGTSVLCSLILRPRIPFQRLGLMPVAVGTAVAEALRTWDIAARTKWPNDVIVGGRKLAGILVETKLVGSHVDIAVVGLGINHDWSSIDVPAALSDIATSIGEEFGGDPPTRPEVLAAVLASIEDIYPLVLDGARTAELLERARRCSAVLGRRVAIRAATGSLVTGIARDLAPDGGLVVEGRDRTQVFHVGEIEQLRPAEENG